MTTTIPMFNLEAAKTASTPAWSYGAGRTAALANDGSILAERRMR